MRVTYFILAFSFFTSIFGINVAQDGKEIVKKSRENFRGKTNQVELTMTIVRPKWTREMSVKSWEKGQDNSLILITGPARDKGTTFLKRNKEMWNWVPSIERTVKLPPSMMMQSWMGSDFTNDDLVKNASEVDDYTHEVLGEEEVEGRVCWKIQLNPKEEAAVVWGKILTWIDKEDYLQLRTEFYDEDEYLVNTMNATDIKVMGGRTIPTRMEMIPEDKPGNKTIMVYSNILFDQPIDDSFFSVQNMKRIR